MPDRCYIVFWRGHGLIPILIRLFSRHKGQAWDDIPSHCAILVETREGWVEYEAVVTGVRKKVWESPWDVMDSVGVVDHFSVDIPHPEALCNWLEDQVGKPYGYLSVLATGVEKIAPKTVPFWSGWWRFLAGGKGGRSAPLDCSALCQLALSFGGVTLRDEVQVSPPSPNDLRELLKGFLRS